jgi:hypothetical protein
MIVTQSIHHQSKSTDRVQQGENAQLTASSSPNSNKHVLARRDGSSITLKTNFTEHKSLQSVLPYNSRPSKQIPIPNLEG